MEYLQNLHLQKDFQMVKLTEALKQIENEIIKDANLKESNVETQILKDLFAIVGEKNYRMSKDRWEIVLFNIYAFIATHTPSNNIIPDFSNITQTKYGPLFFIITILSGMSSEKQIEKQVDFIKKCFLDVKNKIIYEEKTSPYEFYVLSTATYTFLLPSLASKAFKDKTIDFFVDFFKNMRIKTEKCEMEANFASTTNPKEMNNHYIQLSYHVHHFSLELLKIIHENKDEFSNSLKTIIYTLWFSFKASSTLLPLYFNFINAMLRSDKPNRPPPIDKEQVTLMLAENSRFRHNDIFKTMIPSHIFDFFNKSTSADLVKSRRTLRFICQIFFADNQRELFRKMRTAPKDNANANNPNRDDNLIFSFINNQIQLYSKGHIHFPLLFLLEQLSASFGFLTGIIKQIKAIKIGPSEVNYIYFSEQVNDKSDLTELDDLLYSKYEYVSYDNKEDALKAYEKCFKYIDLFQERYILPISFFQKLMDSNESFKIHEHDVRNSNGMKVDGSNSSLFYNVKQLFTSFFKLIIEIGYRYMLLSQFFFSEASLSPQVSRFFSKKNFFDINTIKAIIKKISEVFNKLDLKDNVLQPYAKIIADLLFEAVKERHVTHQLVSYLHHFNSPNPRDPHDSRLYQMVLHRMIIIVYTSMFYVDNLDVETSNHFHQYLLLILDLGRKLRSGMPQFLVHLSQYQKSFMTILLNRFRCTNQREFLNTMIQYTRILNENSTEQLRKILFEQPSEEPQKKRPVIQAALNRYAMSYFRKELKILQAYLILDKYAVDNTKPNTKHIILLYLTSGFQSSDPALISKAINHSLPSLLNQMKPDIIKDNQQLLFDNDSDNCRAFYTSLFKSLLQATSEDSQKIIDSIPQLLLLFNSWKANINTHQIGFIIPRYNVDLLDILNNILSGFSGKESDAIHVLLFLNALFTSETFSENIDKIPIPVIDQIILNLTGLFGYKIIRQKVINLFKILHKKFLPVVAEGNYNYLLSLFFNVQYSYSESNSLYFKIIEMFFNMATFPDSPTFNGPRIINAYFTHSRTIFNFNELLVFFTIIQKRWPECIKDDHFHLYLLSLTINNPQMIQHSKPELYIKPFNNFLKVYIANLKEEQIQPFLSTVIHLIESNKLLFIFKRVFFKRLSKAHFPSPYKDYSHIEKRQLDTEPFFLSLYITILFGVQSNEQIPEPIFHRSIDEIRKVCNRENNLSTSLLFVLIYFIRIVLTTQPDDSRYFADDSIKIFLALLNMANFKLAILDKMRKQIKKCIELLHIKAPVAFEKISKDIINCCLSINSSSSQSSLQSLKNISRQANLFPECIQKEHIHLILTQLYDFTSFSNENKIKALNQTIKFISFLSFPDYKSPQGIAIKQFLMSEYNDPKEPLLHLSYLAHFIHLFVLLYSDTYYPGSYTFFDSIQLFLNKFKKETIEIITSHQFINDIEISYDILYELIMEDETDDFFNLILDKFNELSREEKMMSSTSSSSSILPNHISSQHPAFFNLLNRLTKSKRFSNYPNLGDNILRYFHSVMMDRNLHDNKTTAMNILIDSLIEAIKTNQTRRQIIFITNYIATSSVNTPLYRKWKEYVFKNRERSFYVQYLIDFLDNYAEIRPYEALEIILVQLLKGLKSLKKEDNEDNEDEIDLDKFFLSTMKKLIADPELLTCAMGCFVVYFKYNKPDAHNLPLALSAFGPALIQPNPYCIIHVFKITNILLGETYYSNSFHNSNNDNIDDKNESKDNEDESKSIMDKQTYKTENNMDESLVELLLPILADIIQHVLYFQKFLDQPYLQYVSALLRKANKLFNKNNIPDKLADCFKQFVINKIIKFKEMDKIISVIQLMPVLVEVVPFSMVYSALHNIYLSAHHMRNNSIKTEDNFSVFFFAIKYSLKMKISEDEEKCIFKFNFNFLREAFKGEEVRLKSINDNFLVPLMSKAKYMPHDLLEIAGRKFMQDQKITPAIKNVYASFGILSTEVVDAKILFKNIDFIQKAFEESIKKISQPCRIYVQSIFKRPELASSKLVDHFFFILHNNSANIEISIFLLEIYIASSNHPDKLKHILPFWDKELQLIHYQHLSSFIEHLPISQQSAYLNLTLEKTKDCRNALYPIYITNFINSKKVENSVKIKFLQELPLIINDFDLIFIEKLYEAVQNLDFDTFIFQLLLLFYSIVKAKDSSRLLYYQKLKKLIGNSEEERFITLTKAIQSILWTNQNLPFISFVVMNNDDFTGSSKLDLPLIMLSDMFDSFSSDFMSTILVRIINEKTISITYKLLTECYSLHIIQKEQFQDVEQQQQTKQNNRKKQTKKQKNNYSQIIAAIIKSFHELSIPIEPRLLYKTMKITNDFSLFSISDKECYSLNESNENGSILNPNSQSNMIPDKLLLPHKVNDVIFGSVTDNVSDESLAASAQFFLGNYEEAERIYNRAPFPENNIISRIHQITKDIVIKMQVSDNSSTQFPESQENMKFALFDRFHKDFLLLPSLEQAYSPDKSIEQKDSYKLEQLSRADQNNILYFKRHPHLSNYERQRISAIECIIMLMQNKLKGKKQAVNSINSMSQPSTNSIPLQQAPPAPMIQHIPMPQGPQIQFRNNQFPRPIQMPPQQQIQQPQQQSQMMQQPQQQMQQQQMMRQLQQRMPMQQVKGFNANSFNFKLLPCMNYIVESCFPPSISKFVFNFSSEMSKINSKQKENRFDEIGVRNTKQSPFIVFSSEFRLFFNDLDWTNETIIKPADFHGFFGVNSNVLFEKFNQYLNKLPKQQNQLDLNQQEQQLMNSFDPFLWPSFCFNLFASSEKSSDVLFKITLESYLKIITEEKSSIQGSNPNSNQQLMSNASSSQIIASPVLTMPPYMCLASSARVMNLFIYSMLNKTENPHIFDSARKSCNLIIQEKTTPYLKVWMPQIINLRSNFSPIFKEKTDCLTTSYGYVASLLAQKKTTKPEQKIEYQLDSLRQLCELVMVISDDAFESARRRKEDLNSGKNSNECEDFITMEDLEQEDFISEAEKNIHKQFFIRLKQLNQSMPFEYDRRSPYLLKGSIKIIYFNANFVKLTDNAVTFTCATLIPPRQRFIVERVENTDQIVTFSNVFEGIKNVFKYGYASRQRRIRLSTSPAMELGQHFVMRVFPFEIIQAGKIRENSEGDENEGAMNLVRKMVSIYSPKDFFKMRRAIISSFAAYSVVLNMFSSQQPTDKNLFISLQSAEFPFIIRDFVIPEQFGKTASLITDEMYKLFGKSGQGEIAMSVAAASDALARKIDAVRALVEVLLFGIVEPHKKNFETCEKNFETILAKRDWIDFMILSLAPPLVTKKMQIKSLSSDNEQEDKEEDEFVDASCNWISNVKMFVNNSLIKFDRILFENDFIKSNEINANIHNEESFEMNSEQSSESILNPLFSLNYNGEFNDANSRINNNNNDNDNSNNTFQFFFDQNEDDDQAFNNFDSKDDQTDDFDF